MLLICGWLLISIIDYISIKCITKYLCKEYWTISERNSAIILSLLFPPFVLITTIIVLLIGLIIFCAERPFKDKRISKW